MITTRRELLKLGGAVAGGAALFGMSGCSFQNAGSSGGGAEGAKAITVMGAQFPTLDPQIVGEGMWIDVQGIFEGLVNQSDDGTDVQPGQAEKWTMSEDGLTYTFTLRDGLKWSDDSPVTTADFMFAYQRLLTPKASGAGVTLGANSYVSSTNIKNATQFQAGSVTDWNEVGIKAPDEKTLVFTLASPNPGFLMGLAHPSMLPLPKKLLEAEPQDWEKADKIISNGPFKVTGLTDNVRLDLAKNDTYWDSAKVGVDTITLRQRASNDTSLVPFESKEVDVLQVGDPAGLTRFSQDPELKSQLKAAKPGTIAYLALMHSKNETLSDPRIRQALSLAMGRDTVAPAIPMNQPTGSLVPQSVPGWEKSLGIEEDIEKAKQLLADAGFPEGKGLPPINLLASSDQPLLAPMAANWKKNLGVETKVDAVEAGVYVKKRTGMNADDYIGFYFGTFGSELTWSKWVASLWSPTFAKPFSLNAADYEQYLAMQQDKNVKSSQLNAFADERASAEVKEFDRLTNEAMAQTDEKSATEAFKKAAVAREETYLFIPIAMSSYQFAVNSRITGFNPRPTGEKYYFKTLGVSA